MKTCQGNVFDKNGKIKGMCGKPATWSAYIPPIYFCQQCLHDCMEDESPEVQESAEN